MAAVWKNGRSGQAKASSLDTVPAPVRDAGDRKEDARRTKRKERQEDQDFMPAVQAAGIRRNRWVVDLVVAVVLVALIVAAVLLYRGFKDRSQTQSQDVWVEYGVVLYDVPDGTDLDALVTQTVRLSDQRTGESLGTVLAAVREEHIPHAVQVTVRAPAVYEQGNGYRVGDLRILAGVMPTAARFELGESLSAKGVIVSLTAE